MMRSLFSGVSGVKGHQTRMDVIGNNIANVNTTGFKYSRTTFADMFSQTVGSAAGPQGSNLGGINPKQVGLGVGVASIDMIVTDGAVQSTGKNTDLCLSGNALFGVKSGDEMFYTRDGAFEFDANGNYVLPGTGMFVQGWGMENQIKNSAGVVTGINTTGAAGNITIPADTRLGPKASEIIGYSGNLDATTTTGAKAKKSDPPVTKTAGASDVTGATSKSPAIALGDEFTTTVVTEKSALTEANLGATTTATVYDALGTAYAVPVCFYKIATTNNTAGNTAPYSGSEWIAVIKETDMPSGISLSNAGSESSGTVGTVTTTVTNNTALKTAQQALATAQSDLATAEAALAQAKADVTKAQEVYDQAAAVLQTVNEANTDFTNAKTDLDNAATDSAAVAAAQAAAAAALKAAEASGDATAIRDANTAVTDAGNATTTADAQAAFDTAQSAMTAALDTARDDEDEAENALAAAELAKSDAEKAVTKANDDISKAQQAIADASVTSYSYTGQIEKYVDANGDEIKGVFQHLYFNGDGEISTRSGSGDSYLYTAIDETNPIKWEVDFSLNDGSSTKQSVKFQFPAGAITQYDSSAGSTIHYDTNDGYTYGTLSSVSIDNSGIITGVFSNSQRQQLAQIALYQFNNFSGLNKVGNSFYQPSNNSGEPQRGTALSLGVTLTASALEMSNVDLAEQFSDMIITQRGFQSNSKIITVSDELLETLINMKR